MTALRSALIEFKRLGDIGSVRLVLIDFELAAVKAVQKVFPETTVRGAHFILSSLC